MPYYSLLEPQKPWMDVEKAATDWDGWMKTLDEDRRVAVENAFMFSTPETVQADRKRFISVSSVAQDTGVDSMEVSMNFESIYQPLFANRVLGKNEIGVDLDGFFGEIVGRKRKEREENELLFGVPGDANQKGWLSKATEGAIKGEPWVSTFARSLGEYQKKPGYDPAKKDAIMWQYAAAARETAEKYAPYRGIITQAAKDLQSLMGVTGAGETPVDFNDIANRLMEVPQKDRKSVLGAIALAGATTGADKGALKKLGENIWRGTEDWATGLDKTIVSGELLSLEEDLEATKEFLTYSKAEIKTPGDAERVIRANVMRAGLVPLSALAPGIGANPGVKSISESERKLLQDSATQLRQKLQLAAEIDQVAEGGFDPKTGQFHGIDPATSASDWPRGIYSAAQSLPMTVGSFLPVGAGQLMMLGQFSENNFQDFKREFPEMSDRQAHGLAILSSPIQTVTETIVNRAVVGILPNFMKFAKAPSVTVRELVTRGALGFAGGTAMEMGEEFTQTLTPYVMMEAARALGADVQGVPWERTIGNLKANAGEIFRAVVPMVLVMNGTANIIDFKNGRQLASNEQALLSSGLSADSAKAISEAAKAGDWQKAQTLMREEWKANRVQTDGAALEAVRNEYAQTQRAEANAQLSAVAHLETSGILPTVRQVEQGKWRVEMRDEGNTFVDFGTFSEANAARFEVAEQRNIDLHETVRDYITQADANLAVGRAYDYEFSPEQDSLDRSVNEGRTTREAAERRVDIRQETETAKKPGQEEDADFDTASAAITVTAESMDDRLAAAQILGENKTTYKEGVYRTAIKLNSGFTAQTVVEEKVEGDADVMMAKGRRDWMVEKLRSYEALSGDKIFRTADDAALTNDDVREAWSHFAVSYLSGKSKTDQKLPDAWKAKGFRRVIADTIRSGMGGVMTGYSTFFNSVFRRAAKIKKLQRSGGLDADFETEIARSLGLEQRVHEAGVANEAAELAEEMQGPELAPGEELDRGNAPFSVINMPPVKADTSAFGPEMDRAKLREIGKEEFRKLVGTVVTNENDGRKIKFTMDQFGKPKSHSADPRIMRLIPALPQLLEHGILLETRPEIYQEKYNNIKAWHTYGARANLDGQPLLVQLSTFELQDGTEMVSLYHDHNVLWEEAFRWGVGTKNAESTQAGPTDPVTNRAVSQETLDKSKIFQLLKEVNIPESPGMSVIQTSGPFRAKDAEYMRAVESGDMEGAQKMVDQAAKEAGYNVGPLWHGSRSKTPITVFNPQLGDRLPWMEGGAVTYLSASQEEAEGMGDFVYKLFAKMDNPIKLAAGDYSYTHVSEERRRAAIAQGHDGIIGYPDTKGGEAEYLIFHPQQIKSAEPVTRDAQGNIIPLSKRFNVSSPNIGYSVVSGTLDDRIAAMFDPFQRSPELRGKLGLEMQRRALKLSDEWRGAMAANRTRAEIDTERKAMQDQLFHQKSGGITPDMADIQSHPVLSEVWGRMMNRTEARKRRAINEYDDAPPLPRSFYGGTRTPDQLAQELADKGLLPDAYPATMWKQVEAAYAAVTKNTETIKTAQRESREEAKSWAEKAKRAADSPTVDRARLVAALRTLDAITSALPPEVRAKVGGYVAIAKLSTDESRLQEIEERTEKIDRELEKYLRKDFLNRFEKLLDKASPKSEGGKKPAGKIGADAHQWFDVVSAISEMTDQAVTDRMAVIDSKLAGVISQADIAELRDFGVTTEDEARDALDQQRGLLVAFGDFKNKSAEAMSSAFADASKVYKLGRFDWNQEIERRRAQRTDIRENMVIPESFGRAPEDAEIKQKELDETGLPSDIKAFFGEHFTLNEAVADATGPESRTREWADRMTTQADMSEKDAMIQRNQALSQLLQTVFPGKRLRRLRALEDHASRKRVGNHVLSQFEAIHFSMLWKQERLQPALETHGYGEGFQKEIEAWMTPESKAIRQWLWDHYDGQYTRINEVFRRKYGVNLPREKNYAPAFFHHQGQESALNLENGQPSAMRLGSMGFMKNRVDHAAKPWQLSALEAYIHNAHNVEHWIAWAEPMTELRAVFGHNSVKDALTAHAGPNLVKSIASQLDILEQNGAMNAEAQGFAARWSRRAGKSLSDVALTYKLVTLAKQLPASYASSAEIGIPQYLNSVRRIMTGKAPIGYFEMLKHPIIERRMANYSPEWNFVRKGYKTGVRDLEKMIRNVTGNLADPRAVDLALEWGRQRPGYVDAFFTALSAAAAFDHHYTEAKSLGMTEAQAMEEARINTEATVLHTAQPDSLLGRSLMENRLGDLAKAFFKFQSPNRQAFAMTALAAKKSGWSSSNFRNKLLLHWVVTPIIIQTIGNLFRYATSDDDWDDTWEASDYVTAMVLGPTTGILFLGQVFETAATLVSDRYEPRIDSPGATAGRAVKSAFHGIKGLLKDGDMSLKELGDTLTIMGQTLGGRGSSLGVGWNILKQVLGASDAVQPGDQETVSKAQKQ